MPPLRPTASSSIGVSKLPRSAARHGAAHAPVRMGQHLGARAQARRRARRAAGAHHPAMGPRADSSADGMTRGKSEAARESGVCLGVDHGSIHEGTLATVVLPPEPVAEKPDPDFLSRTFRPRRRGRRGAEGDDRPGRLFGHACSTASPARARPRFISRRWPTPSARGRQSLGPDAGNRAHRAIPRSLRRALRRAAGGVAFGAHAAQRARTWRAVADGEVVGRGRRALGAVPALRRSRPHRRR